MDVGVEIPYDLRDFRVEYLPSPRSGYHQVDVLALVWQEPGCAAAATIEIRGRAEDLRAFAERIIALAARDLVFGDGAAALPETIVAE